MGYLTYVYLDLFSIPSIINFVSFLPSIGDPLQEIATYLTETFGTHAVKAFQNIPRVYVLLLVTIPIFLMFPVFDRIETRVLRKQRGNFSQILKNGFGLTIFNLNFIGKVSNFLHRTFLCLFTDQSTVSIDIPVVNDRNVDTAIFNILSTNQRCYVVRVPNFGSPQFFSEIEKLPKPWQEEIWKTFEKESEKSRWLRFFVGMMKEKRARLRMEKLRKSALRRAPQWMIFAISENECIVYAFIEVPPPTYMTRIIRRLWCSDPNVKERIIDEIEILEQ